MRQATVFGAGLKPFDQDEADGVVSQQPYEDVGDLIRQSDQRLYLFSSDYPHVEGGRNPLGRFEASMRDCDSAMVSAFYSGNFAKLFAFAA